MILLKCVAGCTLRVSTWTHTITLGTARPIALAKLNAITRDVKSGLRSANDNTADVKLSSPCLTLGNPGDSLRTKDYRRVCTRTYSVIRKNGCSVRIDPRTHRVARKHDDGVLLEKEGKKIKPTAVVSVKYVPCRIRNYFFLFAKIEAREKVQLWTQQIQLCELKNWCRNYNTRTIVRDGPRDIRQRGKKEGFVWIALQKVR